MNQSQYKFRKGLIIVIAILAAAILLFVIRSYQKTQTDKNISVIFISKRLGVENDFWISMMEGVSMAASDYNIDLTAMGPESELEYELQHEMIEEAIAMQPDAIALVPSSFTMTIPYAKKIEAAGIKLVLLDSVMEEEIGQCVIATDNYEGGYKMGDYMQQYADETSVIGIVSHTPGASTAIEREQGVRAGLGVYEKQIVEVVFSNADYDMAYEMTVQMLNDHPDMNMIIGLNEDSSVGAARAVKELDLSDKIRLIGFDNSMEQIQLLEEGVFDAIVVQKPLNMGYLGIKMAYEAAINQTIPEAVDSGSVLITKETIYTEENEKLLFPFREEN